MIYINGSTDNTSSAITYAYQQFEVLVQATNTQGGISSIVCEQDWVNVEVKGGQVVGSDSEESWEITVQKNNTGAKRTAYIIARYTDDNGVSWLNTITLYQGLLFDTVIPVWKDIYYKKNVEELHYSIKMGDIEIYNAIATMNPISKDGITINISKIIQDYLSQIIPIDIRNIINSTGFISEDAFKEFTLYIDDKPEVTYNFINDWSYNHSRVSLLNTYYLMSKPINGHADERMLLFMTFKEPENIDDEDMIVNGVSEIYTFEKAGQVSTLVYNASYVKAQPGDEKYLSNEDGTARYDIKYCGDYALYYRNRMGGYDSFLIEGIGKKTDEFNKYTYSKIFNNTSLDFEKSTYNLQINTTYELNTGWLTDEQATTLARHLISSNEVYLHDLKEGIIMPVTMSDASVEYKTYKNQGRQMVKYTIMCEESQTKQIL